MDRVTIARGVASGLAVLAFIDPQFRSSRPARPEVAVVATSPADRELAYRVAGMLKADFTVIEKQWDHAAATVIVGSAVPVSMPAGRMYAVNAKEPDAASRGWSTVQFLARTTGGTTGTPEEVVRAVRADVGGVVARARTWPMRSNWWLVPLLLLLGVEWFAWRRRVREGELALRLMESSTAHVTRRAQGARTTLSRAANDA
jgi:hypothetical protein